MLAFGLVSAMRLSLAGGADSQRNVVFMVADDMRPWPEFSSATGQVPEGLPSAHMPRLTDFAQAATRFTHAYAQISICAPSRASFLTGRYPDATRIWTIGPYFRSEINKYAGSSAGDRLVTLPQHFREHGYDVTGFGKVFHNGNASGDPSNSSNPSDDRAYSWDTFENSPGFPGSPACRACLLDNCGYSQYPGNYSWTSCPCPDECFEDGAMAIAAVTHIKKAAAVWHGDGVPFFLAVGMHRPHLPFIAPSRFFDQLPAVEDFPLPANGSIPSGAPSIAPSHSWECRSNKDIRDALDDTNYEAKLSESKSRELRRAYYAARSFVDHSFGLVLDALRENGVFEDTVVAIIGDHGWHLGEQGQWGKSTNWDHGMRVPLMLRAPHLEGSHGKMSSSLVELVDLFPTLVELAGLSLPPPGQEPLLQGRSLAPLLASDDMDSAVRTVSFSQYPNDPACKRTHDSQACVHGHGYPQDTGRDVMGYTIRSKEWRFTLWAAFDWDALEPKWTQVVGTELYSHAGDTTIHYDMFENKNLAELPEYADLVHNMTQQVHYRQKHSMMPTVSQLASAAIV